jgi:myogenesis-regulating glycosidase
MLSRAEDLLFTLDVPEKLGRRDAIELAPGKTISFDLASGGDWYGHGFAHRQPYPLNREAIVNEHFAANNTLAPIWMCSAGVVIFAHTDHALDVRFNANQSGRLTIRCPGAPVTLRIFRGATLPEAHRQLLAALGWPAAAPDAATLGESFFCTWTQYPRCINQTRILDMAAAIRSNGYPCRTLVLDDAWEGTVGDLEFSRAFPDPRGMVAKLHAMGFAAWLWVTPFVNRESASFQALAAQGFLIRHLHDDEPSLMKWWGGTAGVIDLTNPAAADYYRGRLRHLIDDYGIDGFKLDGGDAKYLPPAQDRRWHRDIGPSGYSDLYLALAEGLVPGRCETRTAWLSQGRRVLWRQGGKDSHWGLDNGLAALVSLALHMSLLGYDILMPDMVPGRVLTMSDQDPLPTDELMVRWTEASAFMPLLEFSYYPWNYSAATNHIVRQYALAHEALRDYVSQQAAARTAPLLRPLWYDHPELPQLYPIADEFLLGSDLIVAPVLQPDQKSRDLCLLPGRWRDAWTGQVHEKLQLSDYPAPCPGIPLFVRDENEALFAALHPILADIPRGTVSSAVTTAAYRCGVSRDIKVTG